MSNKLAEDFGKLYLDALKKAEAIDDTEILSCSDVILNENLSEGTDEQNIKSTNSKMLDYFRDHRKKFTWTRSEQNTIEKSKSNSVSIDAAKAFNNLYKAEKQFWKNAKKSAHTSEKADYIDDKLDRLDDDFIEEDFKQDPDICVICHEKIDGYGNNPAPVSDYGRCCDKCNLTVVIPARLKRYQDYKDHSLTEDKAESNCVLCGAPIEGYGNNPYPLSNTGKCCDECNSLKVIPARIKKYSRSRV